VDQIIHQGPVSTGAFGSHLIGIFDNPRVHFDFAGEMQEDEQSALEYRYRVPLDASHYRIKMGAAWQPIAYGGALWLNAHSLDLERFTVEADQMPAASGMCRVDGALDYERVRIGEGDVLLPRQSRLELLMRDAAETATMTTFGSCREYQADAEIHFDSGEDAATATARPVVHSNLPLPLGLPVILALNEPIDTDTAAAGDPVSARVVKPVRHPGSNTVLIPAGATVRGRITRLEHHFQPQPYFLIALSFNRLVEGDNSSPFAAKYDGSAESARQLGARLHTQGRGLEFWDVGTFLFPTTKPRHVIPAGFESKWETLAQ
jgi:hypothetical protein